MANNVEAMDQSSAQPAEVEEQQTEGNTEDAIQNNQPGALGNPLEEPQHGASQTSEEGENETQNKDISSQVVTSEHPVKPPVIVSEDVVGNGVQNGVVAESLAVSDENTCTDSATANDVDMKEAPESQMNSCEPKHQIGEEYRDEEGGIRMDDIYISPPPPPSLTFDIEGPRLVISHIENENFKSYAGLEVLGPFHKSFTSIVGPNGSGKSNVIDSMLFVFGYRAQKIRSKKVSVLIHDSEGHPNIRSCKVKVHFHEIIDESEDSFRVVPNSHIVVSRTAFKDNTSYYQLNGKRCQYKDVSKELRKQGIDLDHNRFLILQGEVEQIALMKPKGQTENDEGMMEYLEDIIGSSRFKGPIETLHKRVQELDEHRTEKLNRVKLVEKEKDELEKPKNDALEYLHLNNRIVRKKNMGYHQYVMTYEKKVDVNKQKKKEYEEKVKDQLAELEDLAAKRTAKEEKYKRMQKEMERLHKDFEETQENFKKFELEDTKLREEMKNMNAKRKRVANQSKMEKEQSEKFAKIPEKNKEKIDECEELKEKYQGQVTEEQKSYDKALESLKAETQVFQDQKETLETELIGFTKIENEKESNLNIAQGEVDVLTQNEQKEKSKLEQLELRFDCANREYEEKSVKLKDNEKVLPNLIKNTERSEQELKDVATEYDTLNGRIRMARSNYEETRSAQMQTKGRGKVLDALMKQKQSGAIPGIYGRLGDLGAIDKRYDVAISTAGSSALDTILVDTVETATACIRYLKNNDIGRGNFLAHEKTEKFAESLRRDFRAPENAPRLVDLIQLPNDRQLFRTAFYHYLRDTLVANDLDQANRIAFGKQRYRVVSLNGDLIETSGAMSGGGSQKMQGKMGTQINRVDETDLKALERQLQKEEKQMSTVSEKKHELEQIVYKSQKEIGERQKTLKTLKLQVNKLTEERKLLEEQIKTQKILVKEAEPDKKQLEEMMKKVDLLKADFEEAIENSREKKEAVQKLNKKIKEVGGNKVKSAQSKLDGVKNQLDKVKKEITKLKVEIKSAERDLKKSQDKCENYDAEVTETENKMREMKTEREDLEKKGEELVKKLSELKVAEKNGTEKIDHTRESLAKLEAEENKFKSDQIEIDQQNKKYEEAIKEETRNVKHWKREIAKLKLEDIPGEEVEELTNYFSTDEGKQEVEALNEEAWQYELNVMEEAFAAKRPDIAAIDEFKRKESIYLERVQELDEITTKKEQQRKRHDDLRKMRLNEFMEGFGIITAKLKEMYQMITLGGDAELELVDSLDPFTEGIVFSVRPPKKSWKNISNLSGGEKTLSSLALVFALHYYKPTPLYVMDEIDAALDFKNVSIIANYIKERTKNAQFIIISLRSNMFELADRLVGIYKTYNCTKSVTINPGTIGETRSN